MSTTARCGSWSSPIDAADVARGEALLEWLDFVGDEVWWVEARPEEDGRSALVRCRPGGTPEEVLPPTWDVRSKVIEYGGRPWFPVGGSVDDGIVFTCCGDQRVYLWRPGADPEPLSPAGDGQVVFRYSDFAVHGNEVWCMRESVGDAKGTQVARHIVALPRDGKAAHNRDAVRELAATHHFMTGPKIEPGSRRVAWLGWDHPSMPWDTTQLVVAEICNDGTLGEQRVVAGGDGESVTQLEWDPSGNGTLFALADPDGWWNVHRIELDGRSRALCPRSEEFGEALWRIGLRWCVPLLDGRLAVAHGTNRRRLGLVSADGELSDIESPYTEWHQLATDGHLVAAVVASPRHRRTVVLVDPADGRVDVLRAPKNLHDEYASIPFHRTYTAVGGSEVHAHVHPPQNPVFSPLEGERPPYLVVAHGGPTSRSPLMVNTEFSYFTSRGIGVVDVQYGGSTGFGRAYRERLRENWGLLDVQDCATVARGLVDEGLADQRRIAIRGGSAGGWTAVGSLISEPELYSAAAIYYPVLDPAGWRTQGTHDFESRYLDGLIGAWPQERDRYEQRSLTNHAAWIRAPFVLFQGLADTVCPPEQAERLLERLEGSSVAKNYFPFEGEQHGFRRSDTIIRCMHAELVLYGRTFGFEPTSL